MEESESDRISQLPDAILQDILSFIPIKQAVQTSILSLRWQNLWSSMSDLHFNFTVFAIHDNLDLNNWQDRQDFSHRFQHFVSHFLSHCDHASTVRKFHLSLDSIVEHEPSLFIEKCVDYAVAHGVEKLHLHAHCLSALRLPLSFFHSKRLRELELRQLHGVYFPENVSLPHLKTLYLENSVFRNEGGFYSQVKEPFSSFPELEKLSICRCWIGGLVIVGPKLRVLEIIQDRNEFSNYYYRMERIWTPRLTLFRYEGFLPLECWELDFPMLEEVILKILRHHKLEGKWKTLRLVRMLQHFGNASFVTLTLDTVKVLEMDRRLIAQSPSPFPNMKCLRLRKGRRDIPTVQTRVMNYLRGSLCYDSLMVEFPEGVCVIDEDCFDDDIDEMELEQLFGIEDEIYGFEM